MVSLILNLRFIQPENLKLCSTTTCISKQGTTVVYTPQNSLSAITNCNSGGMAQTLRLCSTSHNTMHGKTDRQNTLHSPHPWSTRPDTPQHVSGSDRTPFATCACGPSGYLALSHHLVNQKPEQSAFINCSNFIACDLYDQCLLFKGTKFTTPVFMSIVRVYT